MSVPAGIVFVSIDALIKITKETDVLKKPKTKVFATLNKSTPDCIIMIDVKSNLIGNHNDEYVLSVMDIEFSIGNTNGVYIRYTYLKEIVDLLNKYKNKKINEMYDNAHNETSPLL